jgi:hypothetical protein
MGAIVRRAVLPALLLAGGLACWLCGARFRAVTVWESQETEVTLAIPDGFPPVPPVGEASPFGGPPQFPGRPPMRREVVKKTVLRSLEESEPGLMRDVSVGGVVLLPSGELKRTYSGKAPSLCPT